MTRMTKFAYHVTTYDAAKAIIDSGYIDPAFSQGRSKVCWFVSSRKVTWAIAHVCQRHQCGLEAIAIMTIMTPRDVMKQSNRQGVYYTNYKTKPIEMSSAAIWLQREERGVFIPARRVKGAYWNIHDPE